MRQTKDITIQGERYRLTHLPATTAWAAYHLACALYGVGWMLPEAKASPALFFGHAALVNKVSPEDANRFARLFRSCTTRLVTRTFDSGETQDLVLPFGGDAQGDGDPWEDHFAGARSLVIATLLLEHLDHNFGEAFLAERASLEKPKPAQPNASQSSNPKPSPTDTAAESSAPSI